jgi:hypothetical protein
VLCPLVLFGYLWGYRLWSGQVAIWQVHCVGQMGFGSHITFLISWGVDDICLARLGGVFGLVQGANILS